MSNKIEEILKARTDRQVEFDNWQRECVLLQKSDQVEFTELDLKRVVEQLYSRDIKEETISAVENIYQKISELEPASATEMKNMLGKYFKGQSKIYQLNAPSAYENLSSLVYSLERTYLKKMYDVLPEKEKENVSTLLQKNIALEKDEIEKNIKKKISSLNQKYFEPNNKKVQDLLSIEKQMDKNFHLCGAAVKETGEIFKIPNHLTKDVIEIRPTNTKEGYSLFVNGIHQSIAATAANIEKGKGFAIHTASDQLAKATKEGKEVIKEGIKIVSESATCPPKAACELLKTAGKKAVQITEKAASKGMNYHSHAEYPMEMVSKQS